MATSSAGGMGRAWQWLRALPDRTPLRVKMITAVLALVIIALGVISFASRAVYRGYLIHQARNQLVQYDNQVMPYVNYVLGVGGGGDGDGHIGHFALFNNGLDRTWFLGSNGQQLQLAQGPQPDWTPPQVPISHAWLTANQGSPVTVATQSGDNWLVITHQLAHVGVGPTPNGPFTLETVTVVVGTDLGNVNQSIGYLTDIDLLVSGAVILILAIVGIALVRASLRPLVDIEETAAAIADGDLSQRVPDRDPRTEVGRLGRSLNAMLSQIEAAFRARTESEEAARRSEWRMRQFVADASHELRTPLTAIRGYAEYYRQRGGLREIPGAPARPALADAETGTSPDMAASPRHAYARPEGEGPLTRAEVDRIMQRVEQESSRMGVLVEDMLLLARLDQQRPLERHTVDMLTLAADAVHDARVMAPDRDIDLSAGAGAAFLVIGDEIRLRQVIGNLMSNALHHTPEGTPIEVRVRLASLDEWRAAAARAGRDALATTDADGPAAPAVVLEVADGGPGLTPQQAEHVFERFYRGDQARTRRSGGSGLGLAIVAALVTAHGGSVWVESPPGGGAIFRIAIPLAPEARYSAPGMDDGTDPDLLNSYYPPDQGPEARPEGSRVGRHSAQLPAPPDPGPPPPDQWPA